MTFKTSMMVNRLLRATFPQASNKNEQIAVVVGND